MKPRLTQIDAICYDFDGVIYPYNAIPDFENISDQSWAEAVNRLLEGKLDGKIAKEMARESYNQHGDSMTLLVEWARDHVADPEEFRSGIFRAYYQIMLEKVAASAPNLLRPDPSLTEAFESCASLPKGIASHASIAHWVQPMLEGKNLAAHFAEGAVLGLDDAGFAMKSDSPVLVETCLRAIGGDHPAFVEDSVANLDKTKEHFPQIQTIYIHHGKAFRRLPAYIDHQFTTIQEMKKALTCG